jgi:hypothetical protein
VAKRINILSVRRVDGFWQGQVLLEQAETMLTSEMDGSAYDESQAREAFVHVVDVVQGRSAEIREALSSALLETYNTLWRQGRSAKLTRTAFAKKLVYHRIHASEPDHPSRLISVRIGCPDLLAGHLLGCVLGWDGKPMFLPAMVGAGTDSLP